MRTRKLFGLAVLAACLLGVAACNRDDAASDGRPDGGEEPEKIEYDWQLVGDWRLNGPSGFQQGSVASTLSLKADGSGSSDAGSLQWHTSGNKLTISFADGCQLNSPYAAYSAMLCIPGYADYVMDVPLVGNWYAADAGKEFSGTDFLYWIKWNGDVGAFDFGPDGYWRYEALKWNRTREGGIQFNRQNKVQELVYEVADGILSIEGKGKYVAASPYIGLWKAVDSSEGLIQPQDPAFSTVEIQRNSDKLSFVCKYQSKSNLDGKYYSSIYQTVMEVAFNSQQQLFILLPNGSGDASIVYFRFYNLAEHKKVYLELSRSADFANYVRYEYQTQE